MTVEAKALVDLASEQTSAAGTDLLFVESAGTPSKIRARGENRAPFLY